MISRGRELRRWARRLGLTQLLIVLGGQLQAMAAPAGPSFACHSTTAIEAAICADPGLSARDRTMSQLFAAVRVSALGRGESQELDAQRRWLSERNEFCAAARDLRACLDKTYGYRLNDLAVAALFTDHDVAVPELRRQSPRASAIYEAIYVYASGPASNTRRRDVAKLIAPAFATLKVIPATEFAGRHSPSQPEFLLAKMQDSYAAVASDEAFSTFLAVVSARGYVGGPNPMAFPCAALVKRPGLTAALGSHYGGAVDGRMPRADCATTLPPTPRFDELVKAAERIQPVCEGTIRFSLGADYEMQLIKLKLHQLSPLPSSSPSSDGAHFQPSHAALSDAARLELQAFYTQSFGLPAAVAAGDARQAVNEAVEGAFGLCDGA